MGVLGRVKLRRRGLAKYRRPDGDVVGVVVPLDEPVDSASPQSVREAIERVLEAPPARFVQEEE